VQFVIKSLVPVAESSEELERLPISKQIMKNEITETLRELVEGVNQAIENGDWKVDGRCDPDMVLTRAETILLNCGYRKDELTGTKFYYEEV